MSLARQKDIALLLLKHGRGDLIQETSLYEEAHLADVEIDDDGGPAQLAADLERMGPTFVKLGQLLASRSDIFPPAYIQALERLQDGVAPFSAVEAREVIEADIGARVSTAFAEFEDEPLSAASLAQVHRARMRDGRRVIVKVQRPGIRETIHEDLEALDSLAALAQKHTDLGRRLGLTEMVEQFRRTILRELDFRREARNLEEMAGILEAYPRLVVPRPVMDYSGDRVVTMDYIIGTSVADVSQVAMLDMDRTGAAEDVLRAYLDQILVHGVFHADPHPGNVMLTQDGRIALIDLGMVERFDERRRHELLRLLLAVAEGEGGEAAKLATRLAHPLPDADVEKFQSEVSDLVQQNQGRSVQDLATGQLILEVVRIGVENSLQPPPHLATLGKTLSYLDNIVRLLDPDCHPDEVVRDHAESLMQRNLLASLSPQSLFSSALEMNEFVQQLPERLNAFTTQLVDGKLQVRVDAFDEGRLTASLRSIANRITLGLVLASLIIGAALIMRVETSFQIFGYPGLAMILFLAAAALGLALVVTIARRDYWPEDAA
jgi:predicted unusual protein kinase regulating ubiquinone biosynthesis (AarF/ABC1/UbiB family)